MGTKLLDLWIINNGGLALIHVHSKKAKDNQNLSTLFSGFLSAMESMAQETLDAIRMKDSKILILFNQEPKFFVVGRAPTKQKDENILKLLYKIRDQFIEEFGEIFTTWVGDQSIFNYFAEEIQKKYCL